MTKSPYVYLLHIRDACSLIQTFLKNVTKEEFLANIEKQSAVTRQMEIIGEAVKRVSSEFRANHPEISWKEAAGMRDFLIHDYDDVDPEQLWLTASEVLPLFLKQIENLINLSAKA